MQASIIQPWWVLVLRGIAALAFGVLAFLMPGITLLALVTLFAAYSLVVGAVSVFGAVSSRKAKGDWGIPLLLGILSIAAGAIAFLHPGLTALILVLLIGAYALVLGALDIVAAIRSQGAAGGRMLLGLAGLASVIFGILVFLYPGPGALAMVWVISVYSVVLGILLIGAAFGLRGANSALRYGGPERRINPDRRISHA